MKMKLGSICFSFRQILAHKDSTEPTGLGLTRQCVDAGLLPTERTALLDLEELGSCVVVPDVRVRDNRM